MFSSNGSHFFQVYVFIPSVEGIYQNYVKVKKKKKIHFVSSSECLINKIADLA